MNDNIKKLLNQISKDGLPKIDLDRVGTNKIYDNPNLFPSDEELKQLEVEQEKKDKREIVMLWSTVIAAVFGILSFIIGIIQLFKSGNTP